MIFYKVVGKLNNPENIRERHREEYGNKKLCVFLPRKVQGGKGQRPVHWRGVFACWRDKRYVRRRGNKHDCSVNGEQPREHYCNLCRLYKRDGKVPAKESRLALKNCISHSVWRLHNAGALLNNKFNRRKERNENCRRSNSKTWKIFDIARQRSDFGNGRYARNLKHKRQICINRRELESCGFLCALLIGGESPLWLGSRNCKLRASASIVKLSVK